MWDRYAKCKCYHIPTHYSHGNYFILLLLASKAEAVEQYDMLVKPQNQKKKKKRQVKLTEKAKDQEDSQGKLLLFLS